MATRPPIPTASRPLAYSARSSYRRRCGACTLLFHTCTTRKWSFAAGSVSLLKSLASVWRGGGAAEWLRQRFTSSSKAFRWINWGTYRALLFSLPSAPLIGISAHLDTVFPQGTALQTCWRKPNRLYGPGFSDNAAGVTVLLAVANALKKTQLKPANNIFIGNVGEEGEGNLRGMRHLFVARVGATPSSPCSVIDGAGTDTDVNQARAVRRF